MLDAMTLDQIRTFVTVADSGSFRSGAARLLRAMQQLADALLDTRKQPALADAVVEVSAPGLNAAICRISAILPLI